MIPHLTVVTLVNDPAQYALSRQTLGEQFPEGFIEWRPIHADQHGWNATTGLNHGLSAAQAEWVICAHQDVLFPDGWWECVRKQILAWPGNVAVAGLVGVQASGRFRGHVFDPTGHMRWGPLPDAVASLDEHVIIIRRDSGLRFDPDVPGFHCYGTDLALEARRRGFDVIVVDAPVVHLSSGRIDPAFQSASRWLLSKWGRATGGVIPTCAAIIAEPTFKAVLPRLRARWIRRLTKRNRMCHCSAFHARADK